jgi:REP element-mobilizing transposase RayT
LNGRFPAHLTMRVLPEIPSLRVLNGWVRRALFAAADKPRFRIVQFSIQGNHIHLIAEADDAASMSRGMQGLAIRLARAVNQALSRRRGKVFSDRYHEHVLKTPSEVRAAIHYVIHNFRKHMGEAGRPLRSDFLDEHSSAVYLAGLEPNPLPAPQFWLLRSGYLRAGPLLLASSRQRPPSRT